MTNEILNVSDRIAVIHDGQIQGIVRPKDAKQELGVLMVGGKRVNMKNLSIRKGMVPIIAVVAGFLLGAIIMLIFGYNPIWGYEDLLSQAFGNSKSIGEIFRSMGPLILTGFIFCCCDESRDD